MHEQLSTNARVTNPTEPDNGVLVTSETRRDPPGWLQAKYYRSLTQRQTLATSQTRLPFDPSAPPELHTPHRRSDSEEDNFREMISKSGFNVSIRRADPRGDLNQTSAEYRTAVTASPDSVDDDVEEDGAWSACPVAVNTAEYRELQQKNEELRRVATCKVCLDRLADTLFLPCCHLVTCEDCGQVLKDCPICRKQIMGTVKTRVADSCNMSLE